MIRTCNDDNEQDISSRERWVAKEKRLGKTQEKLTMQSNLLKADLKYDWTPRPYILMAISVMKIPRNTYSARTVGKTTKIR